MKGIYCIKNTTSGKIYVGASIDIEARYQGHILALKAGSHKNAQLQKDFDQQGLDALEFGVLEEIANDSDLKLREIYWIKQQKNCYNVQHWRPASRMPEMPRILKRIRNRGLNQGKVFLDQD